MIISKPKPGTLFALGMFIVLSLVAVFFSLSVVIHDPEPSWFNYLVIATLGPIAISILVKTIWNYKVLRLGKEKFEIEQHFRFKKRKYSLKDLDSWQENIVKTPSGKFKELTLRFKNGFITKLSLQEHTEYKKVVSYLNKKAGRLRID